jgi:hypothetical protein
MNSDATGEHAGASEPTGPALQTVGIDAIAVKPTELGLDRIPGWVDLVAVDYEGREHVPDPAALRELAADHDVRLTAPVRADGFDPRGDDSLLDAVPETVGLVLVAGNGAYLDDRERSRAVAPRLRAAADRARDPWIGTEGVERVALAVGGTQYELLGRDTASEVRALRAAGFEGSLALYAPTVLASEEDRILDAVGDYAARRGPVRRALPEGAATDSRASGRAREILTAACRDYALVGDRGTVRERVRRLTAAGVDRVVAYPARGPAALEQ